MDKTTSDLLLMMALGLVSTPLELLPDMDCATCMWGALPQGGHCFVFNTPPDYHGKCGQYRKDKDSAPAPANAGL